MKNKSILVIFLSLILLLSGCSANTKKSEIEDKVEYKYVKTQVLKKKAFNKDIILPGQTEAFESVKITSRINGEVKKVNKSIGDIVNTGDILTSLDDTTYLLNYNTAKNNYESSVIALNKIRDIEKDDNLKYQPVLSAKNKFKSAEAKYKEIKKNYENMIILYEEGAVSETENNTIESRFISAKENYEMAKNSYLTAKNNYKYDIEQIKLNVKTANNNMNNAKKYLEDSEIIAPIKGIVSYEDVSLGENIAPGKLLYEIVNLDKIYVKSGVSEKDVNNLKVKQKVFVFIESINKYYKGEIISVGPSPNSSTQKYPVKVLLVNDEKLIKEKMYAEISVLLENNKYYSVPKEAVITQNQKKYIFIVEDNKAKKIEIEIIAKDDLNYGVKSNLDGVNKIVVLGQNNLNEGDLIKEE